jgi:hypothetical protein
VIDLPDVWSYELPECLDSTFYSPRLVRKFCLPMFQRMAQIVHARGKYLFSHNCGKLKALAPLIVESQLDCVEGQPHPPQGDWHLHEARVASDRLILCGGMTANEQEWTGPHAPERIRNTAGLCHRGGVVLSLRATRRDRLGRAGGHRLHRFSRSQRATICSPPGVKARSFSAITPRSETVAFSSFRAKMETFLRRCRRRRSSLLRSLQLT